MIIPKRFHSKILKYRFSFPGNPLTIHIADISIFGITIFESWMSNLMRIGVNTGCTYRITILGFSLQKDEGKKIRFESQYWR